MREDELVSASPGLPRCYVASPLGFTEAGRSYYRTTYLPGLARVVEPVDPWSLTSTPEVDEAMAQDRLRDLWLEAGRRNAEAIRSCPLMAAFVEGQEIDSGTAAEVGYAAALGKRIVGLRTDLRQTGEATFTVNVQVESFILESGGLLVDSFDNLVYGLGMIVGQLNQ